MDIYQDNLNWVAPEDFSDLINTGKPFALSEFGPSINNPTPDYDFNVINNFIKTNYPEVVYIVVWHSWTGHYNALVDNQNAVSVLSDPCHVNIGHECPTAGQPCSDGDPNTINDTTDGNCGCSGSAAPSTCELVSNGDFSAGASSWESLFHASGSGTANLNDDYAAINITAGGTEFWSIQLFQENLSLINDEQYELYFSVRSEANRSMIVEVGENGGAYSSYFLASVNATPVWTDHSFIFTQNGNDLVARLVFHLGLSAIDIDLDNISLTRIECGAAASCDDVTIQINQQNINYQLDVNVADWITSKASLIAPANVSLHAGDHIELQAGFEVSEGVNFMAIIEACE